MPSKRISIDTRESQEKNKLEERSRETPEFEIQRTKRMKKESRISKICGTISKR